MGVMMVTMLGRSRIGRTNLEELKGVPQSKALAALKIKVSLLMVLFDTFRDFVRHIP